MRIVYNNRYIDIPNVDPSFRRFEDTPNINLLLIYFATKDHYPPSKNLSAAIEDPKLICQMIHHEVFREKALINMDHVELPNVIPLITNSTLMSLLSKGCTFLDGDSVLGYHNIEEISGESQSWWHLSDKFQRLKRIKTRNCDLQYIRADSAVCETVEELSATKYLTDKELRMMRNLRKLYIPTLVNPLNFSKMPLCQTLREIEIDAISIYDDDLSHCEKLTSITAYAVSVSLEFLRSSKRHPLCDSIEKLVIPETLVSDESLSRLTNLKHLNYMPRAWGMGKSGITLRWITPTHPICDTLEELYADGSLVDAGIQHLRCLRVLHVRDSNIDCKFLNLVDHPLCHTLEDISLVDTTIPLKHLTRLRKLNAKNTRISLEFLIPNIDNTLHPLCHSLEELYLHIEHKVTDNEIRHLQNLRILQPNMIMTLSFLSESLDGKKPKMCKTLEVLDLRLTRITDQTLSHLTNLRELHLSKLTSLSNLFHGHPLHETITKLFCDNSPITDDVLSRFKCIKHLSIFETGITLDFLTYRHPLAGSVEILKKNEIVSFDKIKLFRSLVRVDSISVFES